MKDKETSKVEPQSETDTSKTEFFVLWLYFPVLVILTVVAGYVLWKKISLAF